MSNNSAPQPEDPSVSLSLQSLIDERFDLSFPASDNVQGLSPLSGQISTRRRGQGLEFEDLRNYTSGDDVRHIDWKVSARHNQLYTRLYREEKEQRITLVLDFTSSMFTGSTELRAVQAGRMAANLAWHEVGTGGRCGLMIHTDHALLATRPALGDKAALSICAEIAKAFAQAKSDANNAASPAADTPNILDRLRSAGRESGALIILAGLDKTGDAFKPHLQALSVEKQTVVVCIEDAIEYSELPTGTYRFKSAGKNAHIVLKDRQISELKKILSEQQQQLELIFSNANVPLLRSRHGLNQIKATLHELGFLA